MKQPVILHKSFTLYLEEFEGLQFIHCDVYKWNKTTKQQLKKALDFILDIYTDEVYAAHNIDDNKHRKFLEMYKFKYFSTEPCLDGLYRQVWVKEINNG